MSKFYVILANIFGKATSLLSMEDKMYYAFKIHDNTSYFQSFIGKLTMYTNDQNTFISMDQTVFE